MRRRRRTGRLSCCWSIGSSARSPPASRFIPRWVKLHYPPYWHYDVLQALHVLRRMGRMHDPRTRDAVDLLRAKRLPDGRWRAEKSWWRPPGSNGSNVEVVDWGRSGPNEMITLNALRVVEAVRQAGR